MKYFMDRSLTVRRYRRIDANRSAYSATATAYRTGIQDIRPERSQLLAGEIGKMFDIYVDDTSANIQTGDQVVIAGVIYAIQGKQVIDFGGVPFIHLIGVKNDA